jgi:Uridine kinase
MHSQLDLIPTAVLFLSFYLLKRDQVYWAALVLGFALSIKLHVMAAVVLLVIYVIKNSGWRLAFYFSAIAGLTYVVFVVPFLFSEGFYHLVFANKQQMMMFNVYATVGTLKVYFALFALFLVYGRFFSYRKINSDLLDAFSGIVFSLFVLLIIPAPGWYIWMLPFLSMFFIKIYSQNESILLFYIGLCSTYVLFFIPFYIPEHVDLTFLQVPVNFKINNDHAKNFVFTVLDVFLVSVIYALYRFGVHSNAIYKKQGALVIGIGGDSGAGKSSLMADIKQLLGSNVTELEGDGDHKWARGDEHWHQFTHLDPKANYIHRQAEQLLALKAGRSIVRTQYDHATGTFSIPQEIVPCDFIVLSGLHPFYLPKLRKIIDLKIYLDPDPLLRVHWKIVRDASKRGYSREKVLEQLEKRSVDANKYIAPQKAFADMVISYFPDKSFEVGDSQALFELRLKVTLDSSVKLENFVHAFTQAGHEVEWDYSDDLKSQFFGFFTTCFTGIFDQGCEGTYSIVAGNCKGRY